jgi:hypothetical protein
VRLLVHRLRSADQTLQGSPFPEERWAFCYCGCGLSVEEFGCCGWLVPGVPELGEFDPPNPEFEFPKPLFDPPKPEFDPNPVLLLPLLLPKPLAVVAELELFTSAAPPKRLAACCI